MTITTVILIIIAIGIFLVNDKLRTLIDFEKAKRYGEDGNDVLHNS